MKFHTSAENVRIKLLCPSNRAEWDDYVVKKQEASIYHLSAWKEVLEGSYGHAAYYFMAISSPAGPAGFDRESGLSSLLTHSIVGILPLVHLKHFLFGNSLISLPFFDSGGILADAVQVETALLRHAVHTARQLKANLIELRQRCPLRLEADGEATHSNDPPFELKTALARQKAAMILDLPESSEALLKSFKSKLRSQIRKPQKEGLTYRIGGLELFEDFYRVFSINMRDLGSPVHSKDLIQNVMQAFSKKAKIVVVHRDEQPMACSLIIGFRDTIENPWASSLRAYSRAAPNMLLYWAMLKYACDNGYRYFNFGRSSPDGGTYKFKEQWGAQPSPLCWRCVSLNGDHADQATSKSRFKRAIRHWQRLPVPLTRVIGPMIRKNIGL